MMKATDLMIGDYVYIKSSDGEDTHIVKVKTIEENGINQFNGFIEFSELEPIPLTPEIFEKNKDILYGELPILFDDGKMRYSIVECRYVSKEYERNGENFYCLLSSCVYNGGSFITPFAKIRYVHELQHKLKDLEIEKEIVLWK